MPEDPAGKTYIAQVARSGYVEWSRLGPQPPMGFVVHTVATFLVNRLVFWGGWTVVVWQGDAIAPKRRTVWKRRYRTEQLALDALEQLAVTIPLTGPPST